MPLIPRSVPSFMPSVSRSVPPGSRPPEDGKKNKRGQEAQAHTSRSPPKKKPFARAAAVAAKSVQLCAAELLDGGASPSAAAAADDASCYRLLLDDAADLRVGLRFSLSSSS